MNNNTIISIGFDNEKKYIDISDIFDSIPKKYFTSDYFTSEQKYINGKEFISIEIPKENLKDQEQYEQNILQIKFNPSESLKGNFRLSFSVIGGIDGEDMSFNTKQQNDSCKLKIKYKYNNINENCLINKRIYNVFTQLRNSASDIELHNKYYINISDIESVYNFSNFYRDNFLVSCDFVLFDNPITITLSFFKDVEQPYEYDYRLYLTDFKLERLN